MAELYGQCLRVNQGLGVASIYEEWQPSSITKWDADLIDARAKKLLSDFIHFYPY